MKSFPKYVLLSAFLITLALFNLTSISTTPKSPYPKAFALQEETKKCRIEVTLSSIQLIHNYYLGENWFYWTEVNGVKKSVRPQSLPTQIFQETIFDSQMKLTVGAIAKEEDPNPDMGSKSKEIIINCPSKQDETVTQKPSLLVKVVENNPIFAGFSALWKFEYVITATTFVERKPKPSLEKVKVKEVIDSDTILVKMGDEEEVVKFTGIDVPHPERPNRSGECFGEEAFKYSQGLLSDREVWLKFDIAKRDQFGHLLAYVFTSSESAEPEKNMVNAKMLAQGYAEFASITPNRQYELLFIDLQKKARESGRGLWCECRGLNCFANESPLQGISITQIQYGKADEIVTIKNKSNKSIDISGWEIQSLDRRGEEIQAKARFPKGCLFPPRGMLRVHSGPPALSKSSSSCNQIVIVLYPKWEGTTEEGYAWDDEGGVAKLVDQKGNVITTYTY